MRRETIRPIIEAAVYPGSQINTGEYDWGYAHRPSVTQRASVHATEPAAGTGLLVQARDRCAGGGRASSSDTAGPAAADTLSGAERSSGASA